MVNQGNKKVATTSNQNRTKSSQSRSRTRRRQEKSKKQERRRRRRKSRSRTYEKYKSRSYAKRSDKHRDRSKGKRRKLTPASPLPSYYKEGSTPLRPDKYRPPRKRAASPHQRKEKQNKSISRSNRERYVHTYRYRANRPSRSPLRSRWNRRSPDRHNRSERRSSLLAFKKETRRSRSPHDLASRKYNKIPSPLRNLYPSKPYNRLPPPFYYHNQPKNIIVIHDAILPQGYFPGLFGPPPNARPIIRGANLLIPPMIHPGMFPPRPPRIYNQPYKPRIAVPTVNSINSPLVPVSEANVNMT